MINEKLYIIILNWNGNDDSIECLKSIKNNSYDNYNVILVDNGSNDDSLLALKTWCLNNYSEVAIYDKRQALLGGIKNTEEKLENQKSSERLVFIENNENLGFAAGNNVGLKYLLKKKASYAMLLNNDTVIEKDSISILMDFLKANNDYVAVTPQIRYFHPNDTVWNCGGKITWFGNRRYYYAKKKVSKVPQSGFKNITFITGCALLFKPQITGVLTEKFFFGEEDLDFSFKQLKNNRKMACCFSSVIFHKVSASINTVNAEIVGHTYLQYISRFINIRQYSSNFMFVIKIMINLGYAIPMMILRYKFSFRQIFIMILTIIEELRRIDHIDKEYCFRSLKEDFKNPIRWNNKL